MKMCLDTRLLIQIIFCCCFIRSTRSLPSQSKDESTAENFTVNHLNSARDIEMFNNETGAVLSEECGDDEWSCHREGWYLNKNIF